MVTPIERRMGQARKDGWSGAESYTGEEDQSHPSGETLDIQTQSTP